MAFDKKHYKEIKAFMERRLNYRPLFCTVSCPFDWAKTFLPVIADAIRREDYEGAKAGSDAIREFLNKFLDEPIKDNAQLKLDGIRPIKVNGIICFADETATIINNQ